MAAQKNQILGHAEVRYSFITSVGDEAMDYFKNRYSFITSVGYEAMGLGEEAMGLL